MIRYNLHTHSLYDDGQNRLSDMADSAIKAGMSFLGFSGHSPSPIDDASMPLADLDVYKNDVRKLKKQLGGTLEIALGIELDSTSSIRTDDFDYVIGSVHYLHPQGVYGPIDASENLFASLLEVGYGNDIHALAADYYHHVEELILTRKPQIVGHFDLISKYNENEKYFSFEDPEILSCALDTARTAIEQGALFEINTGAMAKGYRSLPYPHPILLKRIADLGGRFVISSDCHNKNFLDFGMDQAIRLAKDAGIDALAVPVYKDGVLVFEDFSIEEFL